MSARAFTPERVLALAEAFGSSWQALTTAAVSQLKPVSIDV